MIYIDTRSAWLNTNYVLEAINKKYHRDEHKKLLKQLLEIEKNNKMYPNVYKYLVTIKKEIRKEIK